MFNFFLDMGNYQERAVDRFENDETIVDTARCSDGSKPYETGVCNPAYNDGDWVIVESYDTEEEAKEGHNKWVEIMTVDKKPDELVDCHNAYISQLFDD